MSTPEEIRVLRYHMTSGHVLSEAVDSALNDLSDDELLQRVTKSIWATQGPRLVAILITESTSESRVLVVTDKVEFIQVAHADLLISREDMMAAMLAEGSAMQRAREAWGQDGNPEVS